MISALAHISAKAVKSDSTNCRKSEPQRHAAAFVLDGSIVEASQQRGEGDWPMIACLPNKQGFYHRILSGSGVKGNATFPPRLLNHWLRSV
jgi:hypothetical protein